MTDKEWYLLCIERELPMSHAHGNFRREYYEVQKVLHEIRLGVADSISKLFQKEIK